MKRTILGALLGISLSCALACGDDDEEEHLPGNTPCEKWQSLSMRAGCDYPQECIIAAGCEDAAVAWMECTAQDAPGQCTCEMDLSLNCEGSYKPDEGAGLCVAEFRAYSECAN